MKYPGQIDVLCTLATSNYMKFDDINCYDKQRNAFTCTGQNPIIAHPPCKQWSRLRTFAHQNEEEKYLAIHCLQLINQVGGILEHPVGSSLWKLNFFDKGTIISINQHWFGHSASKHTYLYFVNCSPIPHPLNFNAVERTVDQLGRRKRDETPIALCKWLIDCIRKTYEPGQNIH